MDSQALHIHGKAMVADWHLDSLLWIDWLHYNYHIRHETWFPFTPFANHADLPRLKEGGVKIIGLGVVVNPLLGRDCPKAALWQNDILDRIVRENPDEIVRVRTSRDIEEAFLSGRIAAFTGMEGAHALAGKLENVATLYQAGFRYLTLTHFSKNAVGNPAKGYGSSAKAGLSDFGLSVIEECEKLGMIVDLAHLNRQGFEDAVRHAKKPMLVSHTGVSGAYRHWRNIDDEQLRWIADTGGVVGIIFYPGFLGPKVFDTMDVVAKHIEHAVSIVGPDHVALGSDFDGFIIPPTDLHDVSRFPRITERLLRRGMSEENLLKILGGNAFRIFRDCCG